MWPTSRVVESPPEARALPIDDGIARLGIISLRLPRATLCLQDNRCMTNVLSRCFFGRTLVTQVIVVGESCIALRSVVRIRRIWSLVSNERSRRFRPFSTASFSYRHFHSPDPVSSWRKTFPPIARSPDLQKSRRTRTRGVCADIGSPPESPPSINLTSNLFEEEAINVRKPAAVEGLMTSAKVMGTILSEFLVRSSSDRPPVQPMH